MMWIYFLAPIQPIKDRRGFTSFCLWQREVTCVFLPIRTGWRSCRFGVKPTKSPWIHMWNLPMFVSWPIPSVENSISHIVNSNIWNVRDIWLDLELKKTILLYFRIEGTGSWYLSVKTFRSVMDVWRCHWMLHCVCVTHILVRSQFHFALCQCRNWKNTPSIQSHVWIYFVLSVAN